MTMKYHEHTRETWVVEEYQAQTEEREQRPRRATYQEAEQDVIDAIASGHTQYGKIAKLYRAATPKEIAAEEERQVREFDWRAEHVRIVQDMATVAGVSNLLKGQPGDPVFYSPAPVVGNLLISTGLTPLPKNYSWCSTHERIWGAETTRQPCNLECKQHTMYFDEEVGG